MKFRCGKKKVYQPLTTIHLAVLHSAPLWIYFALKACLNDPSANESGKILTSISSVSHVFVFALKSCLVAFFIWFLFLVFRFTMSIYYRLEMWLLKYKPTLALISGPKRPAKGSVKDFSVVIALTLELFHFDILRPFSEYSSGTSSK